MSEFDLNTLGVVTWVGVAHVVAGVAAGVVAGVSGGVCSPPCGE